MPRFSERFSVKGRAEKCKNEGIRVQNMSDLIIVRRDSTIGIIPAPQARNYTYYMV